MLCARFHRGANGAQEIGPHARAQRAGSHATEEVSSSWLMLSSAHSPGRVDERLLLLVRILAMQDHPVSQQAGRITRLAVGKHPTGARTLPVYAETV